MLILVEYNLSQSNVYRIQDIRLAKSVKSEIKEKLIDNLEYKDLSIISRIRQANIKKLSNREVDRYLNACRISLKEVQEVVL